MWRKHNGRKAIVAKATGDSTSLGNILIEKGYVKPEHVQQAVERQLAAAPPLDEILIDMGVLTEPQLEDALFAQRMARGEVSTRDVVKRHLTSQRLIVGEVTAGMNAVSVLSNELAAKMKKSL